MRKSIVIASAAALIAGSVARRRPAGHRQDRPDHAVFRPVCRHGDADGRRHQALHEAERRHRRWQEDRDHPQGFRRHHARPGETPRAGIDHARQGGHFRRANPDSQRARGRRRLGERQGLHRDHERGDLDHHHQVALHGANLRDHADAQPDARHLGGQEGRRQENLFNGVRFRPGHDAEGAFQLGVKEAGGEIVGSVRFPLPIPDFSAFIQRAKDTNPDSIYIWNLLVARSRRRSARRCRSAASIRRRRWSWDRTCWPMKAH